MIEHDLIIECKTLTGYHILFDAVPSKVGAILGKYEIWAGKDTYNNSKNFKKILKKNKINSSYIPEILENLSNLYFPKGSSVVSDYSINPLPIKSFCSFRETNIGNEKELENSVVWKAFQELQGVIKSEEIKNYENIESDVSGRFEYKKIPGNDKKIISVCKKTFKDWGKVRHLMTIHPVLVVNCDLWDISNNKLEPLPYCRLLINSMSGYNKFWFDVVNINHIDEYARIISDHYLKDVIEERRI